jgi:ABC-type multidrug transport system fused ATPase/permease subunit
MHANKILVLEDGGAAGYGSHEELLESCEVYKEICDSQTKTEKGGANR